MIERQTADIFTEHALEGRHGIAIHPVSSPTIEIAGQKFEPRYKYARALVITKT